MRLIISFISNAGVLICFRVVYRQLFCKRTMTMYTKLEKFVQENYGKRYGISAKKLLKKNTVVKKTGADIEEEDRTFFCSELIAKAYKTIDLLKTEKSSCQYWPGSFSSEKKLQLEAQAYLGDEMIIDFEIKKQILF